MLSSFQARSNRTLELLRYLEYRHLFFINHHLFPRSRVACLAQVLVPDIEAAEASDLNAFPCFQRINDAVKEAVNR